MRATVVRDDRTALVELEINPGRANRARHQPLAAAAAARGARRAAHRAVRARGPRAGQGRPVRPPPVPRRPARAAHPAAGRRPRRLRPRAQAAQRPAQVRRRARRRAPAARTTCRTLDVWDPHLARPAPSCSPRGWRSCASSSRWSAAAYASVAPAGGAADAGLPVLARRGAAARVRPGRRSRTRCWRRWPRSGARSSSAGSPWSARTATSSSLTLRALPAKGYASHGESWSFALALRLASYDLLRAERRRRAGADPRRRVRRARRLAAASGSPSWSPAASRCSSRRRSPEDVPAALAGARVDVTLGTAVPRSA